MASDGFYGVLKVFNVVLQGLSFYQPNLTEEDFIGYDETADEEAATSGAEMTVKDAISKRTEEEDIETIEAFEEAVDTFGNVLTGTNFKNGELGTIYTANGYSSDGNNKTSEIDARGNETKYEYDAATSKPTKVIDRCGNATQYQYDVAGRTTKVTAPNGGTVEYEYNSYDDLTLIKRGDEQIYTMAYDAYRNLTQVKVGAQSLVDYTYNSGTNRLKSMTYANGSKQTMTYDRLGRLIAEKWTKSDNTVEAHYRYFYDVSNNLEKTLDISNKRMYNITRNGENVTAIAEYEFASINETTYAVSGLTLIGTMHYSFDSEGKQFRKKYVAADGTEQKYVFEFQDEQNVAVQLPTGVVSHSKSDHLGRKVFDELQLGKGLMNRTFTYHKGEITQAHLDNDKVVSNPETALVKQIEFADGRIIQYEYDAEERITKVIDSVDGTTVYTYDSLGQLVTEKKNGTTINEMVYAPENDPKKQYGNILKKNGVDYTYDTTWKDKLIKVGTQSITYDAQGNPTSYLGHTLTWEKGRQLKSYDTNTYKYNKDGIRISKTVNGVEHKYVLDGTNIVKETWGNNTLIPLYDLDGTVCGINYNGTAYYFYKNLQGDVIAITNDAGATVVKYTYDAWGVPTIVSDSSGASIATINPFRYRGYYYDEETSLYYLQSRYYDANIGRFLNSDVTDFLPFKRKTLFVNLFNYCNNNAICLDDSTGYTLLEDVLSIINTAINSLASVLKQYTVDTKKYKKLKAKLKKLKVNRRANKSQIKQVRKQMDNLCSNKNLFGSKFARIATTLSLLGILATCLGDAFSYTLDMVYILSILMVDALCELIVWLFSKGGDMLGKLVPFVGFILGWALSWCIGMIVSGIFSDETKEKIAYDCYDEWQWNYSLSFSQRIGSLFNTFLNGVWNYGIKNVF